MAVYQTKPPDYEGIIQKAGTLGTKLEFGGGRKTRSGESPNAQIIVNLKGIQSKISISRTGRVIVYYPSKPCLEKCLVALRQCYVPAIEKSDLKCQGPVDHLSKTFELRTTENWKGTGLTLSEASVDLYQWFDPKTGEYIFILPDDDGRIVPPSDPDCKYAGHCPVTIKTIDKDDEKGNRVITGERLRWKAMQELKRISKEHRLTPEDLARARLQNKKSNSGNPDLVFEC